MCGHKSIYSLKPRKQKFVVRCKTRSISTLLLGKSSLFSFSSLYYSCLLIDGAVHRIGKCFLPLFWVVVVDHHRSLGTRTILASLYRTYVYSIRYVHIISSARNAAIEFPFCWRPIRKSVIFGRERYPICSTWRPSPFFPRFHQKEGSQQHIC